MVDLDASLDLENNVLTVGRPGEPDQHHQVKTGEKTGVTQSGAIAISPRDREKAKQEPGFSRYIALHEAHHLYGDYETRAAEVFGELMNISKNLNFAIKQVSEFGGGGENIYQDKDINVDLIERHGLSKDLVERELRPGEATYAFSKAYKFGNNRFEKILFWLTVKIALFHVQIRRVNRWLDRWFSRLLYLFGRL